MWRKVLNNPEVAVGLFFLCAIALTLGGYGPLAPLRGALSVSAQPAAAAWTTVLHEYDGWPGHRACRSKLSLYCNFTYSAAFSVSNDSSSQVTYQKRAINQYPNWSKWFFPEPPAISGAQLYVPAGATITLDWACQDYFGRVTGACSKYDVFDNCIGTYTSLAKYYQFKGSGGIGFSTNNAYLGSVQVTPTQTTTYTLTCKGRYSQPPEWDGKKPDAILPLTVVVGPQVPAPTATIDAGAGNGVTKTVTTGTPVTVTATYAPGAGDTLAATAINDDAASVSVPCAQITPYAANCWEIPDGAKTYTLTPTAPGSHTFSAQVKATKYKPSGCAAANCYNSYKTVTVNVQCPADMQNQGGVCVPLQCPGAHQINYPTCSCENGYTLEGGECVLASCSDPHRIPPPCISCEAGYTLQNGVCTNTPNVSLQAAQSRVRKNSHATLSWSVTGIAAGSGVACAITSAPSGVFSAVMPADTAPSWGGISVSTGPITGQVVFTLLCTNTSPKTATVNVIPAYQEI